MDRKLPFLPIYKPGIISHVRLIVPELTIEPWVNHSSDYDSPTEVTSEPAAVEFIEVDTISQPYTQLGSIAVDPRVALNYLQEAPRT